MKYLEKLRVKETDPKVCMRLLDLYEEIGKILGPEEVGMKILPGIIPMLISGQFTQDEFKELTGAIRRLLDQIEIYRLPTLPKSSV
jgi:HAMP domain-containing protein